MKFINLTIVFLICSLMLACRADKDEECPTIHITSPAENHHYSVYDTILVNALIEDETQLTKIEITITDENHTPVQSTIALNPENKKTSISIPFIISNSIPASGKYYLRIKASDGLNIKNKFVSTYISVPEQKLMKVYLFGYIDTMRMSVYALDSGVFSKSFDIQSDYCATAISSELGLLYTCGKYYGDLNAFNTSDNSVAWKVPVVCNPPFPYFNDIFYYNKYLYCAFYDGYIHGYDLNGSVKYATPELNSIIPEKIMANGNFLFCDNSLISENNRVFGMYYLVSGASKQQISSKYKVISMFPESENSVFIFGNENGQGKIYLYDIDGNGTWESHTLPTGIIYDVACIDNKNYVIAHSTGLYRYDYSMNSLTLFKGGNVFTKIKYENVAEEIYAVSGNELYTFDYPQGTAVSSYSVPDHVMDFQLLYNK